MLGKKENHPLPEYSPDPAEALPELTTLSDEALVLLRDQQAGKLANAIRALADEDTRTLEDGVHDSVIKKDLIRKQERELLGIIDTEVAKRVRQKHAEKLTLLGVPASEVDAFFNRSEKFLFPEEETIPVPKKSLDWKELFGAADSVVEFGVLFKTLLRFKHDFDVRSSIYGENGILSKAENHLHRLEQGSGDPKAKQEEGYTSEQGYLRAKIELYTRMAQILQDFSFNEIEKAWFFPHETEHIQRLLQVMEQLVATIAACRNIYTRVPQRKDQEWREVEGIYSAFGRADTFAIDACIRACKRLNLRQGIPTMLSAIEVLPAGSINRTVAEACSELDPHGSAKELLERIKETDKPEGQKEKYRRLLYLLEMGKVPITNGQLEYLQKKYNLKGANVSKAVSAIRIDPNGKLGLLNADNEIIGYIEFGEFESEEEKEAQIMEIGTELLLSRADVSEQEMGEFEKDKLEFLKKYHKDFFEGFIHSEAGVHVNNLSLQEQFWFYQFLKKNEEETTKTEVIEAAREFGYPFVKAFVALQFDEHAPKHILQLIQTYKNQKENETKESRLSHKDVAVVFRRYEQLLSHAEHIDQELMSFFVQPEKASGISKPKATEEIMKRAGVLFASIAKHIQKGEIDQAQVNTALNRVDIELIVFAVAFKETYKDKKGMVDYSEIEGFDQQIIPGSELPEKFKKSMIQITQINHEDTQPHIGEAFETFLNDKEKMAQNTFIVQTYTKPTIQENEAGKHVSQEEKQKMSGFLRIEERGPKRRYVGAFNVHPAARGAGLGEELGTRVVGMLRMQGYDVDIVVLPQYQVSTAYVEKGGFVAKGFNVNAKETGTPNGWFEMTLEENPGVYSLRDKTMTRERLTKKYKEEFRDKDPLSQIGESVILAEFDTEKEMERVVQVSDFLLNKNGYHLVRNICLDDACHRRLYGFERPTDKEAAQQYLNDGDPLSAAA